MSGEDGTVFDVGGLGAAGLPSPKQSNCVRYVRVRADKLRNETGGEFLNADYLFVALVQFASKETVATRLQPEQKNLKDYLELHIPNPSGFLQRFELGEDAESADAVLARAETFCAEKSMEEITAVVLAEILLDNPSAQLKVALEGQDLVARSSLYSISSLPDEFGLTAGDDNGDATGSDSSGGQGEISVLEEKPENIVQIPFEAMATENGGNHGAADTVFDANTVFDNDFDTDSDNDSGGGAGSDVSVAVYADADVDDSNRNGANNGDGITDLDIERFAEFIVNQMVANNVVQAAPSVPNKRDQIMKIGMFKYRGGVVAAFAKHLLIWITIPAIVFFAMEYFQKSITSPPTLWAEFAISSILILWAWYILQVLALTLQKKFQAMSLFLEFHLVILLVAGLLLNGLVIYATPAGAAPGLWWLNGFDVLLAPATVPMWARVILACEIILVLLFLRMTLNRVSRSDENVGVRIKYGWNEGTFGALYLRYLAGVEAYLVAIVAAYWIFPLTLGPTEIKWFWLLGLIVVMWSVTAFWQMFNSWHKENVAVHNRRWGHNLVEIIYAEHAILFLPAFVYGTMWIFGYLPMATPILVIFGLYGAFWLMATVAIISTGVKNNA